MSKPWETGFTNLRPAQVYKGVPPCENLPGCGNRAAILLETPDHRAIDLCVGCAEDAFSAGAFTDRWALDNLSMLNKKWLPNPENWKRLREEDCKDGITYEQYLEQAVEVAHG